MPGVILPFPGGIVRSGSKVGSRRYKSLDRVHERRLLPDAAAADGVGTAGRRELACSRSCSMASTADVDRAGRCGPASTRRAARAFARSPPATTAASSALTISICARSWARRSAAPHERGRHARRCARRSTASLEADGLARDRVRGARRARRSRRCRCGRASRGGRSATSSMCRGERSATVRVVGDVRRAHGLGAGMAGGRSGRSTATRATRRQPG